MQAFFSMAVLILNELVTVKSSPTIWILVFLVRADQASQSSWSKGSSIEQMSYFSQKPWRMSASWTPVTALDLSDLGF